jgi:hypothetical protein
LLPVLSQPVEACDPSRFKDTVATASATINQTNVTNAKALQDTLQKWRVATGLSEADFAAKAAPLIKDQVTASIDADNQALLAKVQTLGGGGGALDAAKCEAMAGELKSLMDKIAANTDARWKHMMGNVAAAATATVVQAGAAR